MKVLMLNGSAKSNGNTFTALEEIGKQLNAEGIEYEIFQLGGNPIRDCIGCGQCTENGCFGGMNVSARNKNSSIRSTESELSNVRNRYCFFTKEFVSNEEYTKKKRLLAKKDGNDSDNDGNRSKKKSKTKAGQKKKFPLASKSVKRPGVEEYYTKNSKSTSKNNLKNFAKNITLKNSSPNPVNSNLANSTKLWTR